MVAPHPVVYAALASDDLALAVTAFGTYAVTTNAGPRLTAFALAALFGLNCIVVVSFGAVRLKSRRLGKNWLIELTIGGIVLYARAS
eukprot:2294947-Pleurochrysis_carterae.AAC.5